MRTRIVYLAFYRPSDLLVWYYSVTDLSKQWLLSQTLYFDHQIISDKSKSFGGLGCVDIFN